MNEHIAALVRFWWLACLALVVAAIAGAAVIYEIRLGLPPELDDRTPPSYTATSRLLLNSAENPLVRTGVTEVTPRPPRGADGEERPPMVDTAPPGLGALVDAANLLPLVIESDEVAELGRARVGSQRGTLSAIALFARETPGGGLRPSSFPVIEVRAVSPTSTEAVQLVRGTVGGFEGWLVREQERAEVPPRQRIVVQPLNRTPNLTVDNDSSYGLALLVVGAVLAGAAVLITVLHRTVPPEGSRRDLGAPLLEQAHAAPSGLAAVDGEGAAPRAAAARDGEGAGTPRDRLKAWLDEPASGSQAKEPPAKAKAKAKGRAPGKAKAPRPGPS